MLKYRFIRSFNYYEYPWYIATAFSLVSFLSMWSTVGMLILLAIKYMQLSF
jgi:hypothetical protein